VILAVGGVLLAAAHGVATIKAEIIASIAKHVFFIVESFLCSRVVTV